ncbi:hypothetical protein TL16_g02703 [Triparma laevis f. inornata]|uniref:Fe2OG dioxygenase domain-containing protein n=2 Tax=Triparma laevis TaxID=1534972 RepID=A0A9W7DYA4_9STRA|nr:hypothetical protein TL16_g02703 [Triparma laevis f. inornata]GMH61009.1 hypothetical protein TrLO_g13667 [Triparma laevis f. longispina]
MQSFTSLLFLVLFLVLCKSRSENTDSDLDTQRSDFLNWQRGISKIKLPSALLNSAPILKFRGGDGGCEPASSTCTSPVELDDLIEKLGSEFKAAIELNVKEHEEDCRKSCEIFYCGEGEGEGSREYRSYNMGSVPPEDFQNEFSFPLNLIRVTEDSSTLLTSSEAKNLVKVAESEGVLNGEYKSGKYKLGGDWLENLPKTLSLFNSLLKTHIYPELTSQFPQIISSPTVLRPHSVALLRYNSTHPRTDTHVDNGILAMTLALSYSGDFKGGGTYFEHLGKETVDMEIGGVTFRPGSVRHGGSKVTEGERYILGAFMLIEDKVEHVRRLKNRGAKFRGERKLEDAKRHFEWALELNPKCVTCLKDLSEVYLVMEDLENAELHINKALEFIPNDSDGLFSLGVILSKKEDVSGSITAYENSLKINEDDHELHYNLALKYAEVGSKDKELTCYENAVNVKPDYGPALLNWGSALAETENYDEASVKFRAALIDTEVTLKAAVNLATVDNLRANRLAVGGDLGGAVEVLKGSLEEVKKAILEGAVDKIVGSEGGEYLAKARKMVVELSVMLGQVRNREERSDEHHEYLN